MALTQERRYDCLISCWGDPMKPYVIGALVVWVLCGFAGAGLLGDHDWQTVAKGPISLVNGFNKDPD